MGVGVGVAVGVGVLAPPAPASASPTTVAQRTPSTPSTTRSAAARRPGVAVGLLRNASRPSNRTSTLVNPASSRAARAFSVSRGSSASEPITPTAAIIPPRSVAVTMTAIRRAPEVGIGNAVLGSGHRVEL